MANNQYEMAFEKTRQNYKKDIQHYNFGGGTWKNLIFRIKNIIPKIIIKKDLEIRDFLDLKI